MAVRPGPHGTEIPGGGPGYRDRGYRDPRAPVQVRLDHLVRVHPVHVIGPDHEHEVGPVAVDEGQRLVDGVRRACLPARAEPLLRRDRRHVVVQQAAQPPGGADVPVQAVALVLGQHADALHPAIHQVRQREIHHPVEAAERDGRLGPVRGQRPQPAPGPARQDDAQDPLPSHRALTPGTPAVRWMTRLPGGQPVPGAAPRAGPAGAGGRCGRTPGCAPPPASRPRCLP